MWNYPCQKMEKMIIKGYLTVTSVKDINQNDFFF